MFPGLRLLPFVTSIGETIKLTPRDLQGMHELLAPILLVVDRERFRETSIHADDYT